nr:MAG: hypothetical protein [Microvirus sp.]
MVKPKQLKDELRYGNVSRIEIVENIDLSGTVYFQFRNYPFEYRLDKNFRTVLRAFSFIYKLLDKPIIEGLIDLYKGVPPIIVRKTQRSSNYETHQSETQKKQKNLFEWQPCPPEE